MANVDTLGYNGDMKSGIYQIANQVNGKRYVGSAVDLEQRWRDHLAALRHERHHNRHLQAAFNKYGEEVFTFTVLEDIEDASQLVSREQHYLDTLNPEYNIAPMAGSQLGYRHSLEARRKVSEANRGERHPNFGKHLSAETRAKISAARMGQRPSEETRAKQSAAQRGELSHNYGKHLPAETRAKISAAHMGERHPMYGKHHSLEARRKISEANSGKRHYNYGGCLSVEHRRNISEAHRGKSLSADHRRKLSAALMGHLVTDDTRAKISAAQKARWRRVHAMNEN